MILRNASEHVFTNISSERFRTYEFPEGEPVCIENPIAISVSESGGHRILDAEGISHYVPAGWIHLFWQATDDQPHFVK